MSDLCATAIENDGMIDPFRFSLICWFNWMNICVPWFIEALFPAMSRKDALARGTAG
jgi:hypothetical protein